MTRVLGKVLTGLAVVSFCVSASRGQSTFGTISGTVTDPSGAIVLDVQVTLTNLDTNVRRETMSNADGIYVFANVLPGNYRVDAERTGFSHFRRQPIVVEVQQSYRIDV